MNYYPDQFVECECIIIDHFADNAFHASLPNGKVIVCFVQKREADLIPLLQKGHRVHVTINPSNFDCARIRHIVEEKV